MPAASRPLPTLSPAQIRPLRNRLRQSIRDAGLTDLSPTPEQEDADFWDLDPTPLIIPPEEWDLLEAGIKQRARLTNAFLHDLYGKQEALHAGAVPPEVPLADPYYRRPCLELSPDRFDPAPLIRFDLIKTEAGWHFVETHTNTPVGLSYAVQNRRFLTQEASEYYRALPDYHSIINSPLELVDHLRGLAPSGNQRPSMVFLTTGPRYPFFSEHSFLARKMGLRLAQGDDLLVLDNRVYFKTVAGLEQVDVIYRRVNDAHIDPVVFSTDFEAAGIPGLMQCIRAGTVAVANAIGAGVAENRALPAYLPALARFYLGETLTIPSIPTWLCTDTDHVDAIIENANELELWPTHSSRVGTPQPAKQLIRGQSLPKIVREQPEGFVARPRLQSVPLVPGRRRDPGFRLSVFALTSRDHVSVVPGGIVNIGPGPHPADRVGPCADVVVLAGGHATAGSLSDFETSFITGAKWSPPSSRAAESLFWLGRYLERAEATARMLGILDDVAMEEIPSADRQRWLPLWRGLLAATGHEDQKIDARADPRRTLSDDLLWRMTLSRQHPSSLLNTVGAAAANARELREFVSPEAGSILTRIDRRLRSAARQSPTARTRTARTARNRTANSALSAILIEINACLGSTDRTMLQDAGWQFMQLGKTLERATFTASTLKHIFASETPVTRTRAPDDDLIYQDNPELSALLRMLGSQDAYRRLYRTRSQPLFVAQLLLQHVTAPRSILHNLREMRTSLEAIHEATDHHQETPPLQAIHTHIDALSRLDLTPFFTPSESTPHSDPRTLKDVIDETLGALPQLHQLLSDHYFSHQARIDPPDPQAELGI